MIIWWAIWHLHLYRNLLWEWHMMTNTRATVKTWFFDFSWFTLPFSESKKDSAMWWHCLPHHYSTEAKGWLCHSSPFGLGPLCCHGPTLLEVRSDSPVTLLVRVSAKKKGYWYYFSHKVAALHHCLLFVVISMPAWMKTIREPSIHSISIFDQRSVWWQFSIVSVK